MLYQTERLVVRHMDDDDVTAMYQVYSDLESMRWVGDGDPITMEECLRWWEVTQDNYAKRGYGMSPVVLRSTGQIVGFAGFVHPGGQAEVELKYAFLREVWGRGLATEMARGMLDYGHSRFGMTQVIATIHPDNLASQRVMSKVGMVQREVLTSDSGESTLVYVWSNTSGDSH